MFIVDNISCLSLNRLEDKMVEENSLRFKSNHELVICFTNVLKT